MISGQLIGSIDDNDVTFPAIALIELCLLPGTGAGNAPGAGAGGQRGVVRMVLALDLFCRIATEVF
ncbi:hypothetical protein HO173_003268 [Letharia columbiana]|uniref:Uncharacterized protein n=1 Tax=Letharia columbiana TaxID=112416 RepID=A0A8H6G1H3_9LECA|nr:uncharacterized protein HO173_003268 [Letharia columbiana]KAF6238761.1 hypothetical protein HO173_003268 [Letharia columbiana]